MSISLTSPAIGSTNWGSSVNANWTAIGNAFSTSAPFSGTVVIGTDPGGASLLRVGGDVTYGLIAAPGTLVLGQMWQDSTQQAWFSNLGSSTANLIRTSLSGAIFTQTATLTIASSAVQSTLFSTGIGTKTLPANFWTPGKTVRITMMGTFSALISTTIFFQALYGATSLGTSATYSTGSAETNVPIVIVILITCRTTGTSGTVFAQGTMTGMNSVAQGAGNFGLGNTVLATINTTTSNALDVQFKYGASSASNSISITNALIEVLN